jgi:hypothetical protein
MSKVGVTRTCQGFRLLGYVLHACIASELVTI